MALCRSSPIATAIRRAIFHNRILNHLHPSQQIMGQKEVGIFTPMMFVAVMGEALSPQHQQHIGVTLAKLSRQAAQLVRGFNQGRGQRNRAWAQLLNGANQIDERDIRANKAHIQSTSPQQNGKDQ